MSEADIFYPLQFMVGILRSPCVLGYDWKKTKIPCNLHSDCPPPPPTSHYNFRCRRGVCTKYYYDPPILVPEIIKE
ncbi:hypothetical protein P8452_36269 [Trifolium repens]|nr:hypothetical protein P8452_36269 [Trifolium repens]